MSIQYIYDLIPLSIDRVVEEVLSEYEWADVENKYIDTPIQKPSGMDVLRSLGAQQAGLAGIGLFGFRESIAAQQGAAFGNNCYASTCAPRPPP